jgi:WD40 repeat protein
MSIIPLPHPHTIFVFELLRTIQSDYGIYVIAIDKDNTKIVCGCGKGIILIYNILTGDLEHTMTIGIRQVRDLIISNDNQKIIVAIFSRIQIYNLETYTHYKTLHLHERADNIMQLNDNHNGIKILYHILLFFYSYYHILLFYYH